VVRRAFEVASHARAFSWNEEREMVGSVLMERVQRSRERLMERLQGQVPPEREEAPEEEAPESDRAAGGPELAYFHVTSRCHLSKYYLAMERPKEILAELCLHYARLYGVQLLDYSLMDNHFHLTVGVPRGSEVLAKMVGSIKQQFTRAYKEWFNQEYRPTNRYRQAKLERGTLWDGPYFAEEIADFSYLMACTLYVETNRLEAECSDAVPEADGQAASLTDEEILEQLKSYRFHSTRWYLSGPGTEEPVLTDGTDGEWATEEEVAKYWKRPRAALPAGWRKVWCKGREGILKPPPKERRRYAPHPFVDELGKTPRERSEALAQHLVAAFWKNRREISARQALG
jgi:REP element-mobilizing transposase RayT